MKKSEIKLGELLIQQGLISEKDLQEAIRVQKKEGGRIGEALIRLEKITEEGVISTVAKQLNIPYLSGAKGMLKPAPDQKLEKFIPYDFAEHNLVLPLSKNLNSLTVALYDPLDLIVLDNIRKLSKCEVNPVISTKVDLERAIKDFYSKLDVSQLEEVVGESYGMLEESLEIVEGKEEELSLDKIISKAEEVPVIKLVNLLLKEAIKSRASDIHIEPFEKKVIIRYRIDGVLYEIPPPAWHLYLPIISRIKILSKLDIAEKRLPQDGGFNLKVEDRLIDIRVSSMPTLYGEKIVMRILDKGTSPMTLSQLGFDDDQFAIFKEAIQRPYGLIFLTGPTGSGKTTTLYAALNMLKSSTKNIITIEDPVEYRLEGINQVGVKPHIGLTFASGLRATLRQDPDIVLVGEVRDMETAEICVRAALTGHLVLSTLHTNDAPTAITRLVDIGVQPFLVSSSLVLVAAQRLVRKLCPKCKEAYKPDEALIKSLGIKAKELFKPKGCDHCRKTGYYGRIAIYEVMGVNEEVRRLIIRGVNADEIKKSAKSSGMRDLWTSGLNKVEQGLTSAEELSGVAVREA